MVVVTGKSAALPFWLVGMIAAYGMASQLGLRFLLVVSAGVRLRFYHARADMLGSGLVGPAKAVSHGD